MKLKVGYITESDWMLVYSERFNALMDAVKFIDSKIKDEKKLILEDKFDKDKFTRNVKFRNENMTEFVLRYIIIAYDENWLEN